jgi:hypothetical protein
MRTTPEFILEQPQYHFAAYVRGLTDTALSIGIPATDMNAMPRMTRAENDAVRKLTRERYARSPDAPRPVEVEPDPSPTPTLPVPDTSTEPSNDDWRS